MPSRMSMLTGQYPSTIGVTCNGIEMPEDLPHMATIFKSNGYTTANIGKLHFLNHATRDHAAPHPPYDFDHLQISDEPGCYEDAYINWIKEKDPEAVDKCRVSTPPAFVGNAIRLQPRGVHQPYDFEGPDDLTHTAFVGDQTREYLKKKHNHPFFCIAGFYAPHSPLNPPPRFSALYNPSDLPLPIMNLEDNTKYNLSDESWQKVKAYYYAMVTQVDEEIGKILETLEEIGEADNTIIAFTADHGEHLGDHGLIAKGPPGLDSCLHIPLIITKPDIKGGVTESLVEAVDIAPTLLDLAGIKVPDYLQGKSTTKSYTLFLMN